MLPSSEYAQLSGWSGSLTVRSRASIHYLSGEFDMLALDFFEDAIMSRLDGDDPIVLDLSELTFMDSSGFYAIVRLAERLGYPSLVIRNPSPAAARVLELTRVEDVSGVQIQRTLRAAGDGRRLTDRLLPCVATGDSG